MKNTMKGPYWFISSHADIISFYGPDRLLRLRNMVDIQKLMFTNEIEEIHAKAYLKNEIIPAFADSLPKYRDRLVAMSALGYSGRLPQIANKIIYQSNPSWGHYEVLGVNDFYTLAHYSEIFQKLFKCKLLPRSPELGIYEILKATKRA